MAVHDLPMQHLLLLLASLIMLQQRTSVVSALLGFAHSASSTPSPPPALSILPCLFTRSTRPHPLPLDLRVTSPKSLT